MRVFISWSGERSHQVANALKEFVGDIIQSVTPFVSDQDITSGERWAERLKEELQENQYGILSITNDNKSSPWLLFEAGALSNSSHKIPVVPFLYDIKPSELTGSPLLQFQAVIYYSEDNARKLINDINDACGDSKLDATRLERAFGWCYPIFEQKLKDIPPESNKLKSAEPDKTKLILEELLDLTRGNQKLLSSNDYRQVIERIEILLRDFDMRSRDKSDIVRFRGGMREFHPMMIEELLHFSMKERLIDYGLLMCLSIFRDDLPWLYDAGKELINAIKEDDSLQAKEMAIKKFADLIDFTFHNPVFSVNGDKDEYMVLRELPSTLHRYYMRPPSPWESAPRASARGKPQKKLEEPRLN
ncbi:MAG: toll/interleukin-1 receptor domain-containing protein [Oscillospiraceae bacterium]|nr:toll/interleukin-1 receptor domain-containing protein [Oscillospiraceae bacterium]